MLVVYIVYKTQMYIYDAAVVMPLPTNNQISSTCLLVILEQEHDNKNYCFNPYMYAIFEQMCMVQC